MTCTTHVAKGGSATEQLYSVPPHKHASVTFTSFYTIQACSKVWQTRFMNENRLSKGRNIDI